jgi:polyisoprenoid-binding protein YceI
MNSAKMVPRAATALLLLTVGLAIPTDVSAGQFVLAKSIRQKIEFHSKATMESITGKAKVISAQFDIDPSHVRTARGTVTVDLKSLDTGIGLRDKHMRDNHLHADSFPAALFTVDSVSLAGGTLPSLNAGEPTALTIHGQMALHGVTKPLSIPAKATYRPADPAKPGTFGILRLETAFGVKLSDYAIPRPEFLFLKLSEEVKITIDLTLSEQP